MAERRQADRRQTSRWQEASLFASRNWLGALVLVLAILSAVLTIKLGSDQSRSQRETIYDNRLASQQSCTRANPGRVAQVEAALDQAQGNRARAHAWRILSRFPLDPALNEFVAGQIMANEVEAAAAIRYAHLLVNAQQEVAKDPAASNFSERVAVDCRAVFPLPDERGDELPEPTKP